MRVAVFASGGGTNLQALFDTCRPPEPASIVLVVSDKPAAGALERAKTAGVATHIIDDPTDGEAIVQLLLKAGVDLVVLAGYLKHVPVSVVREYDGRMINVHPALLPSFGGKGMYGIHVHRAVIESGAAVSGVTIHLVNEEFDRGAPLAQWPVPVRSGDTPETLAARTLEVEHQLLPLVVLEAARHGKPVRLFGATEAFSGAATHELGATLRPL
jgi:formyltetrahydrofolate-dependent phosphoribosylglycinamide formyltransferase